VGVPHAWRPHAYESSTIKRVVTSSTEAECNALATVGKENTWERRIYAELKGVDVGPTPIWGDNTASIAMIGAGMTKRSRHYAIEWHKVSDLVEAKEMSVQWVATQDNLADFFTKKLPRQRFVELRDKLMGSGDGGGSSDACNVVLCNMLRVKDDPFDLSEAFSGVSENTDSLLEAGATNHPCSGAARFHSGTHPSCA